MNESLAFKSPIVKNLIKLVMIKKGFEEVNSKNKLAFHSDLVPKFSQKIIDHGEFQQSIVIEPLKQPAQPASSTSPALPKPKPMVLIDNYEKFFSLIKNPAISYIECEGPGKPVTIVVRGQKQRTNIFLDQEGIKKFLKYMSDKTNIPIIEGVFRVRVDNLLINAMISEEVGQSFMISKTLNIPRPIFRPQ